MDYRKIGGLILSLRKEKGLTQRQLAECLNVSDKAISKWERGMGCPDVSLLPSIAEIFGVDLESILKGTLSENAIEGGNMKKLKFYVCPTCGNFITGISEASISCCGKKLAPLVAKKAQESEKLSVEHIENDYFISSDHPMTKEHYISFVALLTGDSVMIRKQYPEWDLSTRIPRFGHGILYWHCVDHGLFYQPV
ncbi:MAG: helix-turn-helix domain-containing protein [Clostridiaceae bacterium]|nr:helix-turn-helix domain-containing protein [Clostridiaceae bacterium]